MASTRVASDYDAVAQDYADRVAGELDGKPLDRALLRAFAEQLRAQQVATAQVSDGRPRAGLPDAVVADVGCGPGHVTAVLARHGLDVLGLDVSTGMVTVARRRQPELRFAVASVLDLPVPDGAWAGAVALYSLIHLDDDELGRAFRELHRVVRPAGLVLVAVHTQHLEHPDDAVVHLDDWWGTAVDLDFHFRPAADVGAAAVRAGFVESARVEREPYAGAEAATRRAYLVLRRD